MAQKIQIRHDTAANWTSVNPVLMVGEQGYETDAGKSKIGDGTTAWASLAYVSVPSFTGSLVGDVTGTQSATVVSAVGGSTAANVHTAEAAANAATNAATASTIMKRDSNANVAINNFNEAFVTTATAAGTTTLTVSSAPLQQFTGTTTQAVNLPDATTLPVGCQYYVFNRSTGIVTVKDGSVSHTTVQAISGGGQCCFTLAANGTTAGTWDTTYTYTGTLPVSLGGTGATTPSSAFDALAPTTTKGDFIVRGASSNVRLGVGSDGQVPVADSTQTNGLAWKTLQQGAKNYITYNSFENNSTTGWSLAHSALDTNKNPTSAATAGTAFDSSHGGSAAAGTLALSTVSSGQLAGSYSASLASSGATTAGDMMISQAYPLDLEDQAKWLNIKAYYKASSGASNMSFTGLNTGTWAMWIYDVTNGAFIQPSGVFNFVQSAGVGIATGGFQTPSNMTQFQIALVCINASAGACTMLLDDISVGPGAVGMGPAMTDWQSWTPTGSWTTNTTYTGFRRRVGDTEEYVVKVALSGAPNTASLSVNLPSGRTIDTTKQAASATYTSALGFGSSGASGINLQVLYNTTTSVVVAYQNATSGAQATVSNTVPRTFGAGDEVNITFQVPIVGWSSNTAQSSDTDTRVIVTRALCASGTQNVSTNNSRQQVTLSSTDFDSCGAFTSADSSISCIVSGYHKIHAQVFLNGLNTLSGQRYILQVMKGATYGAATEVLRLSDIYVPAAGAVVYLTGEGRLKLNAGEKLYLAVFGTGNNSASNVQIDGTAAFTYFEVERLSGPAVVQATETISARYTTVSAASVGTSDTLIVYGTKAHDTHGFYNSTTGVATIPAPGKYSVDAAFVAGATLTSGQNMIIRIRLTRAGSTTIIKSALLGGTGGTSVNYNPCAYTEIDCLASDQIDVVGNSSVATNITNAAGYNELIIRRLP